MSSFPTTGHETTSPRTATPTSQAARLGRYLLQGLFALILIATSVGKALDVPGFVHVVSTYRLVPAVLGWPVALTIIGVEAALAVWLLSNRRIFTAGIVCSVLHFGYVSLATITLLRGIELDNCGCFGVFLARPLGIHTVVEDAVLTVLSIGLVLLARSRRVEK